MSALPTTTDDERIVFPACFPKVMTTEEGSPTKMLSPEVVFHHRDFTGDVLFFCAWPDRSVEQEGKIPFEAILETVGECRRMQMAERLKRATVQEVIDEKLPPLAAEWRMPWGWSGVVHHVPVSRPHGGPRLVNQRQPDVRVVLLAQKRRSLHGDPSGCC